MIIPLGFACFILLSGFLPDSWAGLGEFDREAIADGQYWRIVTGQWLHFGINHSLMNAACLALVQWQLLSTLSLRHWLGIQSVLMLSVGLGLYFFSPQVVIYRGYSGAFCGLLAYAALCNLAESRWMSLLFIGLLVKIISEQMPGYNLYYLQPIIGVAVATDAHLYGFISGTLTAGAGWFVQRYWRRQQVSVHN